MINSDKLVVREKVSIAMVVISFFLLFSFSTSFVESNFLYKARILPADLLQYLHTLDLFMQQAQ